MRVAVFESNLLWSSRLVSRLAALGHDAIIPKSSDDSVQADVAIVNLGDRQFDPVELIPRLRSMGVKVIVHAGHKETPLLDMGKTLDADAVVTNSQLTHKLEQVLEQVF